MMDCGHDEKWMAYRNPVDASSERYCVFCEIERLEAILADVRTTGRMIIIDGENWIAIPRSVWMEASK